ncbi:prephenate dehydratase [Nocardioides pacificus]
MVPDASPRFSYLGPEGTFTEQALRSLPEAAGAERHPAATVTVALDAVRSGESDGAVVPIENSVEGSVPVTLDELATGEHLMITREMTVPIRFSLFARAGTTPADVRVVGTHPHAAAQTRRWVAEHLPGASVVHTTSTAAASAGLADGSAQWDAAISAPLAGERYGLETIADGIGDNPHAMTRFVLVTRPGVAAPPTGADKTSLVVFIRDDHPGALLELLEEFTLRGVNLSRIESRPTGVGLGRYCFSIDCEGHVADARVGEALTGLRRTSGGVRFLGSYPRADQVVTKVRPGTSDRDFTDAAAWLESLRRGQ